MRVQGVALFIGIAAYVSAVCADEPNANEAGFEESVSIEIGMLTDLKDEVGATDWFEKEIALFQKANTDIQVHVGPLASPSRLSRPLETIPTLPRNVMAIDAVPGYEASYLASKGLIVPIDKFLKESELDEKLPESLFGPVTFDGKRWGLPWSAEWCMLAYNTEILKAAGISGPPTSWGQLFQYAHELNRDRTDEGKSKQVGLYVGRADDLGSMMLTILFQRGGSMFLEGRLDPANSELLNIVAEVQEHLHQGTITMGEDSSGVAHAMRIVRPMDLRSLGAEYSLASFPTEGLDVSCMGNVKYYVVRKSNPAEEAASWKFIEWMSRADVSLPKLRGSFPVRLDTVGRKEFSTMIPAELGHAELAVLEGKRLRDLGPANLMNRDAAIQHFYGYVLRAFEGEMPLKDAMTTGANEANALLEIIPEPSANRSGLFQ